MSESKSKLKPEIEAIAEVLRKNATINDNGVIEFAAETLEQSMPDGYTPKQLKTGLNYVQHLSAAQALVTGELAVEYFKKHKDVNEVKAVNRLPAGYITTVNLRNHTSRNPIDGSETKHVGYVVKPKLTIQTPGSSIKEIRARIADLMAK